LGLGERGFALPALPVGSCRYSETRNRGATFQAHIVAARIARDLIVRFPAERLARWYGQERQLRATWPGYRRPG